MAATFAKRGARTLIAGALCAVAAMSLPANAAGKPAPTLVKSSIDSGWSALTTVVSFQYDRPVDRALSNVELRDTNNTIITGVIDRAASDSTILFFKPDGGLDAEAAPYSITVTGHSVGQDVLATDTVSNATFNVDALAPRTPSITSPASATVVGPSDTISVTARAQDLGASGVAKVVFNIYNPVLSAPRQDRWQSVTVDVSCTTFCPQSATQTASLDALITMSGQYTIKVASIDLAGNVGPESAPLSLIVARTPAA